MNVRCSVNCSSSVDWLEYLKLSSVSFIEYSTRDSFTRSYQSHNLILKAATSCIYRDWFSLESITALKCIHFFETQDYAQLYHLLSKLSNLLRTFTCIELGSRFVISTLWCGFPTLAVLFTYIVYTDENIGMVYVPINNFDESCVWLNKNQKIKKTLSLNKFIAPLSQIFHLCEKKIE